MATQQTPDPYGEGFLANILGMGGQGLGAIANSQAGNRGAQFTGQLGLAQLLQNSVNSANNANSQYQTDSIAHQKSDDDTQQYAWRKLLSTEHLMNPQAMPNISKYATQAPAPTGQALQGAQSLRDQVMSRIVNGSGLPEPTAPKTYDPTQTVDPKLLQPGKAEKIGGWLSPILGGIGSVLKFL